MSNTIKFNKSLIATMVATSMLAACGGDDVEVQDTRTEIVEIPTPTPTPADPVMASAYVSVVDGNTMAALSGASVEFHVDGKVVPAVASGTGYAIDGLPTNSDFIVAVNVEGKATAYAQGTTNSGALNIDPIAVYDSVPTSVSIVDMMGAPVTGLSLYVNGADAAGIENMPSVQMEGDSEFLSSIPNVFASESNGVYTFMLPANGTSFDVEVAGAFASQSMDYVVVGGAMSVAAGQSPMVYVDDAHQATLFTVSFGLEFADGSMVTQGPEHLYLNDGELMAAWDDASQMYWITDLSFAQVMNPIALDMVEIDGVMFAAMDVASAGLPSFDQAASSANITLAMNTDTENGEALPIEYKVVSSSVVAGTEAKFTVIFNQPVEILGDRVTAYSEFVRMRGDLENYSFRQSGREHSYYFFNEDGTLCEDPWEQGLCPTETVLGDTQAIDSTAVTGVDEEGNNIVEGVIKYKADNYDETSTWSQVTVGAPMVGTDGKILAGTNGWVHGFYRDAGSNTRHDLIAAGEDGAEFSWNEDKTVLTITLNSESYDADAETPVLPTGHVDALPRGYFNATDLQHGEQLQLSFVTTPVEGSATAIDVMIDEMIPEAMAVQATAENLVVATGAGIDVAATTYTNEGYQWTNYEGQENWLDSDANWIDLPGLNGQMAAAGDAYWQWQQTPDGQCTFSHPYWDNGTWQCIYPGEGFDYFPAKTKVVDMATWYSYVVDDYEVVSKMLYADGETSFRAAYLVSPEPLTGNVTIVKSHNVFWDATANDGLGGAGTGEREVNEIVGINLEEDASYGNAAEEMYYVMHTWDNTLIYNGNNKSDVEGSAYGLPVRTGFPSDVMEGKNYFYKITNSLTSLRPSDTRGTVTHITVNLNLTTASGETIRVENVMMPVK
ncbi:hypothetical protein E2K93_02865 [Thalassotalea sp. HSM 43]|uniref:hypothetical protein n=1 Tax=Thalassotalea sp. HSM 43 TaxID=2552945 RepID=UPI00107FDAB7|nr:hypothetical protein [Thalassotalea sp. HSM 43]QBY03377.1 hypothetical protein E2K93_02865 [Thalassotalea sp. HSM 43]